MARKAVYNRRFRSLADVLTCMSAKAATGVGTEIDVSQFAKIGVVIIGAGSTNLTVKCAGSFLDYDDAALDMAAAQSATNPWDYLSMKDLEDAANVDGDTGVAFAGSADVRQFEVNTSTIRTLNFNVTAFAAGSVTVLVYPCNNQ